MTLKPLGLKDSLIQPSSLEPLRSPAPLERSLTPLGPSLQPLGNSVMQPLLEVNEDWEIGNWELDAGMQGGEDGGDFAGRISRFSDDQLSIISRAEINSQASETLPLQKFEENYQINRGQKNEPLSANAEALNTSETATNNIAQLKPLGILKSLIQTAGLEISSLSELPQFVQKQSTPSLENLGSVSEETSSLSNSRSKEPSDLPVINNSNNRSLGFNDRLISPFMAEPLPQQPTISTNKLNLTTENLPPAFTTNRGEVEAIAPNSLNLISPQISPLSSQQPVSLQPEISQEPQQDLTVNTEGEVEASGASSLDLIQSKSAPASSQEITALQLEASAQKAEDLTTNTEEAIETIAPSFPDLIQSKISPFLSQESAPLSPYINKEQQGLPAKTETEVIAPDLSNLIQAKVSSTPTQEIIAPQLETIQEQQNLTVKTDGKVDTSLLSPSNLIQSQLIPASSQETTAPQPENLIQKTEDLTNTTEGEVGAITPTSLNLTQAQPSPTVLPQAIAKQQDLTAQTEGDIEVETSVASSPNSIQSKASPVSTQEAGLLQLESTGEETENLIEEGEMSIATSPNSIQSKASPISTQEANSLQLESLPEATEGLTEKEGETIIATSPNLIQSKASPATSQEASLLQLVSLPEETEENTDDSTAQNDGGEVQQSTTDLSKSISAKVSLAPNQEIVSPQLETSQEQQQDLIDRTEPEVETSVVTSPNLIQSQTSPVLTQDAELLQLESSLEETENRIEEEAETSVATSPNLIQPKASPVSTPEAGLLQLESISGETENLTEEEGETRVATSPNFTQSQTLPAISQEAGLLQLESTSEKTEDLTTQTDRGEVQESTADLSNLISVKVSSISPQEIVSSQLEANQEKPQYFTDRPEPETEANVSTPPSLIQPQISPASTQEADLLQLEPLEEETEDSTAVQIDGGESQKSTADLSNSLSAKVSPALTQEIVSRQLETNQGQPQNFIDRNELEEEVSVSASSNSIQSKASPVSSQEANSLQLESLPEATEGLTEEEGETIVATSPNSIQSQALPASTQKGNSLQLESLPEASEGVTEKEGETSIATFPNPIQPQTSPASTQEADVLQLESLEEATEGLTEEEGETSSATSLNSSQPQTSPATPQEGKSLQLESLPETTEGLTEEEGKTSIATSPNSSQSKASPVTPQDADLLQLESLEEETEDSTAVQIDGGESQESAADLSNSISAKVLPTLNQEIVSPQLETNQEQQHLTDISEAEKEASVSTSSNSIQSQTLSVPSQEADLLQLKSTGEETQNLTEEEGETSIATFPNSLQSQASPATPQETNSLQLESISEGSENLLTEAEGETSVAASPNFIQSQTFPLSSEKVDLLHLESVTEPTENLIEKKLETSVSNSQKLTQSQTLPATAQEANLLPRKSISEETEDLTNQTDGVESQEFAANLSHSISAQLSSISTQAIAPPQIELSQEKQQDLTARAKPEVETIVPAFGNLTQTQLSPRSLPEATEEQQENLTVQAQGEVKVLAPTSSNLIQSQASSTLPPKVIGEEKDFTVNTTSQGRLERSNLNSIEPLGTSMPFVKMSDLFLSNFVTDAANKPLAFSQENHLLFKSSEPNISQPTEKYLPEACGSTNLEDTQNIAKVENIPNSWSNISELLGETTNDVTANIDVLKPLGLSQGFNKTNNLISPSLQIKHINSGEKQNNIRFDAPTSWSNISELLGANYATKSDNIQAKETGTPAPLREQESSPSYTLFSPDSSGNFLPTASPETSQQIIGGGSTKNTSIDDEQLEHLAQKVYTLMRQWLEIEQERQGNQGAGYPTWLSSITSIYGTSAKVRATPKQSTPGQQPADAGGEVSPVDDKLQKLAREIYYLTQQRLEIEQERQGGYCINF